jgi:hypothetical protein
MKRGVHHNKIVARLKGTDSLVPTYWKVKGFVSLHVTRQFRSIQGKKGPLPGMRLDYGV